jgi:hypothetical protein
MEISHVQRNVFLGNPSPSSLTGSPKSPIVSRMVRNVWLVGLISLLFCPSAWATNRILVFDSIETTLQLQNEAREAIKAALMEHQFSEVAFANLKDSSCGTLSCQVDLARQKNVDYLLLLKGMAGGTGYQLFIELRDVTTGRILGSDSKECELCDPKDFSKAARDRTTLVLNRVQQEIEAQKALKPLAPKVVPEPPPSKTASDPTTLPSWIERGFWEQPLPVVGLGLAVAGAGALGFGIYMLAIDGKDVCAAGEKSPCPNKRDSKTWGLIATGTGALGLIVGSALAIWGQDSKSDVQVMVSPNSIGLWGRF